MLRIPRTPFLICLLLILPGLGVRQSLAASREPSSQCQVSTQSCLEEIELQLKEEQARSFFWYSLKLRQLDLLFKLNKFDRLEAEVSPWFMNQQTPLLFQTRVAIFRAKLQLVSGHKEAAKETIAYTLGLLKQTHEILKRPNFLIDIANLQLDAGLTREAFETLKTVEQRFASRGEPEFLYELYGNLGHAASRFNEMEVAFDYYQKALDWSIKSGDLQQVSVWYANLAWAKRRLKAYPEALGLYDKTIEVAGSAGDTALVAKCYLAQVEILLDMGELDKAALRWPKIDPQHFTPSHRARMEKAKERLEKARL